MSTEVSITPTYDNYPSAFVSPSGLPDGLILNKLTGVISGVPTISSLPAEYTVVAKNQFGSSICTMNIEVLDVFDPRDPSF